MNQKIAITKHTLIAVLLLSATFFVSCEKNVYDPPALDPNQQISFKNDIVPIFTSNCSCHLNTGLNPNLSSTKAFKALNDGGYINKTTPESSGIYVKIMSGHNSSGVSDLNKQMILQWIKQNALDN